MVVLAIPGKRDTLELAREANLTVHVRPQGTSVDYCSCSSAASRPGTESEKEGSVGQGQALVCYCNVSLQQRQTRKCQGMHKVETAEAQQGRT